MSCGNYAPSLPREPPDDGGEQRERGAKRAAEQRERAIENRLRIHSRFHANGRTGKPIVQRLLPDENVSALSGRGRVVELNAARQVNAERHEFVAAPSDVADSPSRRRAYVLKKSVRLLLTIEAVARPRERRRLRELMDVAYLDLDMHESPPMTPKRAQLPDGRSR